MSQLIEIILSDDPSVRNTSLEAVVRDATLPALLDEARQLDAFRRESQNLYHRVRALFFLSALYRYHIPRQLAADNTGLIPFEGYQHLLGRRFGEAIDTFLAAQTACGPSDALTSALAEGYHQLGFQTLANQVRRSVRTVRGNQWMFRIGHPDDHPLRLRRELLELPADGAPFPLLIEKTAVRMDFSHSAWSDIFFLGMDFPEGARVLNVSVDLGVRGRDERPRPPIETYLRVIDQPVLRLTSVDLGATADIAYLPEMFDFARDYLGLLKAAVIAAGLVPPGLEGCEQSMRTLLSRMVKPGLGLELVSKVNDIPKGSRLAVSTNLLGSLISICMRATGQVSALTGPLAEEDRRIVAARAILGEWLGGSGGGWQDSGGIWPGIKLIEGTLARQQDPEYGISRGRLLPTHHILEEAEVTPQTRQKLQRSLVLVHGGMAQNVGPILEMVTEKYLLRSEREWTARQEAMQVLDEVVDALKSGDVARVGAMTTRNFTGPLQQIIPWATNRFTDLLIERAAERFGEQFWGFWMLGGMAGGGMGFIFDPAVQPVAQDWLQQTMSEAKSALQSALPFAMEPVVYDFAINDNGTFAELRSGSQAMLPEKYYALLVPGWLRSEARQLSTQVRRELEQLGDLCRQEVRSVAAAAGATGLAPQTPRRLASELLQGMLPQPRPDDARGESLQQLLAKNGFDAEQHAQIRADLRAGRIGLSQNRLSASTIIEDVQSAEIADLRTGEHANEAAIGRDAITGGQVAVVTLAAGVGSRWTGGAGVVKALHPFCRLGGRHRNFLEVHLAKTKQASRQYQAAIPHIFTTGYLTDAPIRMHLKMESNFGYEGPVHVSSGRSVGLRMVPMVRDLRFAWEELPQQILDEQQQKVRESLRVALMQWARQMGEGEDYTDNVPWQCLHPVGHWYEIPNMLRNGTLHALLEAQPSLSQLLLHNIDTLGANVDPMMLGRHIASGACLSFEVISRRLEDRGGGLARVGGAPRLIEGLAMPDEEAEFRLSFYNTLTTWIDIDKLLQVFGLNRKELADQQKVNAAVRRMALRMPTYVTLKDVKKRWGHGQEDVFPVAQFEKLWGDMSALPEVDCSYLVVPLRRGQQLKQPSQLDGWLRDGSASDLEALCEWS
jgi:hypothetical protein